MSGMSAMECCSCGCGFDADRLPVLLNCGHQPCQTCVDAHSSGLEKRCPICSKKSRQQQSEGAGVTVQGHAAIRLVRLAAADVATTHDAVAEELHHAEAILGAMRAWAAAAAERQDLAALCAHAACAERVRAVLREAGKRVLEEARRCQDHEGATGQHPCTHQELPPPEVCVPGEFELDIDCEGLDEETKLQVPDDFECLEMPCTEGQRTACTDNISNPETTVQDEAPLSARIKTEPRDSQDMAEQSTGQYVADQAPVTQDVVLQGASEDTVTLKVEEPCDMQDVVDQAPVVQDAVVQGAAEDTVAVQLESCRLESLPRKLVHAVLAFLPTAELLSMRLLSHRWNRLVQEERQWRHRRLSIPAGRQGAAGILRLAPALAELDLEMSYPPLQGEAALRALAEGHCQVRTLRLKFLASAVTNRLITRALRFQRRTVRELFIKVTGCRRKSNLVPVLEAIDALEYLETLDLKFGMYECPDFEFRRLRVKNLVLEGPNSERTRRSLIDLGRDTLRKLVLPSCRPVSRELARCSRLATLVVRRCHGLREVVPQLHQLKTLAVVGLGAPSSSVAPWLRWAHDKKLPVKTDILVRLSNADHFQDFADSADSLCNAQAVAIYATPSASSVAVPPALLTRCLQSLTSLETLRLEVATDYEEVLRCWSPSTAPRLQELTVRVENPAERFALELGFITLCPSLEVQFL